MAIERRPITKEEIKIGMHVTWLYTTSHGWNEIIPIKGHVTKINPKTIQIKIQQRVKGQWIDVKRNVKLGSLRHPIGDDSK